MGSSREAGTTRALVSAHVWPKAGTETMQPNLITNKKGWERLRSNGNPERAAALPPEAATQPYMSTVTQQAPAERPCLPPLHPQFPQTWQPWELSVEVTAKTNPDVPTNTST